MSRHDMYALRLQLFADRPDGMYWHYWLEAATSVARCAHCPKQKEKTVSLHQKRTRVALGGDAGGSRTTGRFYIDLKIS
ncbi:hypothetical protein RM96_19455 [Cupriavidus sp. IDO]|nr:hypothetical protein RM96_19455 [Cupriavidus sp. IDO]